MTPRTLLRPCVIACLGLAALIFSSRLWLIHVWGSPVPFWDQWDAEALGLYIPWLDGTLGWKDFFAAHNEHRIVLARLAAFALFLSLDRWDVWAELLLNALLHTASAVGFTVVFWRSFAPKLRPVFLLGLAVLFCAPFGWENALWGFQTHFYFATLLLIAAFAGLCGTPPGSRTWCAGLAAAALALGTNGGGLLIGATAIGVLVITKPPGRPNLTFFACAGSLVTLIITGFLWQADAPHHHGLHTRNLAEFWSLFSKCLAWPHMDFPVLACVLQAPVLFLVINRWRHRRVFEPVERVVFALALFSILSAAALAYSRGHGLPEGPLSRHQDILLPGLIAQLAVLLRFASQHGRSARIALLGWSTCLLIGLLGLSVANLTQNLPYKRYQDQASLVMVRTYVSTKNVAIFKSDPRFHGPHPSYPPNVAAVLDNPLLRSRLPVELFQATDAPVVQPALIRNGRLLTLISAALFALTLLWIARAKD